MTGDDCTKGAVIQAEVENLKEYQSVQNGHLKAIRNQLWGLTILMLTTAGSTIIALVIVLTGRV